MSARAWADEWLIVGSTYDPHPFAELYADYSAWCKQQGRLRVTVGPFRAYLLSRGLRCGRFGADRVFCVSGTVLEEQSDLADGVGHVTDCACEGQRNAAVSVVRVEIVFEVDHGVIRAPRRIVSEFGSGSQVDVHAGEPTEL